MPVLELEKTGKYYDRPEGRVIAMDDITLRLEPGDFLAIQGPSGSGKTTLLLAAGGLLAPDRGTVRIDDREIYRSSPGERARVRAEKVGFIFQQFHLLPYLNALDNVLAPTIALGKDNAARRGVEMLEKLNLGRRTGHFPSELSTGERQRVALARALINRPSLLLADEPTGNLDDKNAAIVLDYLSNFTSEGGAVLMVTHSRETTSRSGRIMHLEEGKIVSDEENNPPNPIRAENIFPAIEALRQLVPGN